jgi:hypothetical protein
MKTVMSKIENPELAARTWILVAQAFRPGSDRINSYKLAATSAERWIKQVCIVYIIISLKLKKNYIEQ